MIFWSSRTAWTACVWAEGRGKAIENQADGGRDEARGTITNVTGTPLWGGRRQNWGSPEDPGSLYWGVPCSGTFVLVNLGRTWWERTLDVHSLTPSRPASQPTPGQTSLPQSHAGPCGAQGGRGGMRVKSVQALGSEIPEFRSQMSLLELKQISWTSEDFRFFVCRIKTLVSSLQFLK